MTAPNASDLDGDAKGRPLAVLVVADSENDAVLAISELRAYGFDPIEERVDTADAMAGALGRRRWDVVLAAYRMARFSGPLALELANAAGVPFIVVSGTVGEEAAVAMIKAGAHDLVLKHEVGRLGAAVDRAIEDARSTRASGEFLSLAIHEITAPLAVIKMAVQLAQEHVAESHPERCAELLPRLARQCDRLHRIVTEVLEVSRLDLKRTALNRVLVDFAALVERGVGEARKLAPRREIALVRNDPVHAMIDPDRIDQVLSHLLDNAFRYSPAGSGVEVVSQRRGMSVMVSVRDHGSGIPAHEQARIFERYRRAHPGTASEHATSLGVGLYLSHEFVTRHGGRIWFDSLEGKGCTFSFSLPIEPGGEEAGR